MKYISITEKAAIVRKSLKEIGITSKQVSVKSGYCGYSDKLNITIKDLAIKEETVKDIANQFVEYERDARSGEILEGGNTYVFIDFDYDAKAKATDEMRPRAAEIFTTNKQNDVVAKTDDLEAVYFPLDELIQLFRIKTITDKEGTYRRCETVSRHVAYNEYDIASALGFWKYQHNLAI